MARVRIFSVILIFAGATLLFGTGAFSTISAERTASISAAGDANAHLQMVPYTGSDGNGHIANIEDGVIQISGLNIEASTDFDKVFNISNHGTQSVAVWITEEGDHPGAITFYNPAFGGSATCENGVESIEGQDNAVQLDVGATITVSIIVDNSGLGEGVPILDTMVVHADAGVNGATSSGTCADDGDDDDDENNDEGDGDDGDSDDGDSDEGDSDDGNGDGGNGNQGNSDDGNGDDGGNDEGNSDDGNGDDGSE